MKTEHYFVKYKDSGEIVGIVSCAPISAAAQYGGMYNTLEVDAPPAITPQELALLWVNNGVVEARPAASAERVGNTLINVPIGAIVHIKDRGQYPDFYRGTPYPVETDTGTVELDFPAGYYTVTVEDFPKLDKVFEVAV